MNSKARHPRQLISFCLCAAAWGSGVAFAQQPIAPEVAALFNIAENGGFEDGGEQPSAWGRHPRDPQNGNLHRRDTVTFHSGKASGLIRWVAPIAGENKAPLQFSRYNMPIEGGAELIVAGYHKRKDAPPARVGANIYSADNVYLGYEKVSVPKEAQDWTYFTGSLPMPAEAARIGFVLYSAQGGDTWYDDIVLLATPSTEAHAGTPRIDGLLDDACWTGAQPVTAFVHHEGTALAKEGTQAWLAFDDEYLYLAFSCSHPESAALRTGAQERDGDTWLDDSVEVFLDPWHAHEKYYHFAVNAKGVVRDARALDVSWDCGVKTATRQELSSWSAELAIPYADLDLDLRVGEMWGINLARNDRVTGETVTWSLGGFHNPARFGNIALSPNLSRLLQPALLKETSRLAGQYQTLKKRLEDSTLTRDSASEAYASLDKAHALLDELREKTRDETTAAKTPIRELRAIASAAAHSVEAACAAAAQARFAFPTKGAFKVVPALSMQKIRRTEPVTDGLFINEIALEAARDESESFQLVLIPAGQPLEDVAVTAAPLKGPGKPLTVAWHRVAYVETGEPRDYTPEYIGWWPDILLPPASFNVPKDQRQPLWFRVDVPPDALPGIYEGQVTITARGHAVSLPVTFRVRDFRLPRPGTLPAAFGLYAHALSHWYHGNEPYQDVMSPEVYSRWCEFLGKYRLTPKNIGNEYLKYEEKDGEKRLDMSVLHDLLAPLALQYYPPYSFCVYRLPCPKEVREGTTKADPAAWVGSLKNRAAEYERLGFPKKAYVYGIDEPTPAAYPFVERTYRMVRDAVPGFPIMQTVNHEPPKELAGLVDIWCPLSSRAEDPFYRERLDAGDTLWTYVCCAPKPPYANFFVDQPAIDHRMVFWQARQVGATGVLYWCVCWWKGIPGPPSGKPHFPEMAVSFTEAHTLRKLGTNGDGILVWPGPGMTPYPSLRLEVVRDGIEDYEYLALLARRLAHAKALPEEKRPAHALLKEAQALCLVPEAISHSFINYTKDPEVLLARRSAIADMIEQLPRD